MRVHQVPVGRMANFSYVAADEGTGEAVVIDPSWDLDRLTAVLDGGLRAKYIINTHHHFDHTEGNAGMREATGAKVVQHAASGLEHDVSVADGDEIEFGKSGLRVIHTPGHSADSVCLVGDGKIFTGDTLFVGSCGRVDLPGGSAAELHRSLFSALAGLDDSLVVYPGHDYGPSPTSTLGAERASNPVMQRRTAAEFARMLGQ